MAGQAADSSSPALELADCVRAAFTHSGLKGMGVLLVAGAALALYFKFSDRFGGSGQDPRGFTVSREGTYEHAI